MKNEHDKQEHLMSDPEPDLQSRLRGLAEARVQAQIAAANQRAELQRQDRAEFSASRAAGLRARHAAKTARNRLAFMHHGRRGA